MPDQQPALSPQEVAMAAKFDEVTANAQAQAGVQPPEQQAQTPEQQAQTPPQRPENVPEKFWDAEKGVVNTEALLKSYTELEATKGKAPEQTPPAGTEQTPEQKAAAEAAKAAKLDMASLESEYAANGALSDDSIAKLEAVGFTRTQIDAYIAGQEAIAAQTLTEMQGIAGGAEQYGNMIKWAGANLPQAEQNAFDAAINSGNKASIKQAITALKAQFDAANGTDPNLLGGRQSASGGEADTPFTGTAEMVRFMQDPRYRSDPAYRAMVERRAGLTQF